MTQILEEQKGVSLVKTTYSPPQSHFTYESDFCTKDVDLTFIYVALEQKGYSAELIEIRKQINFNVQSSGSTPSRKLKHKWISWRERRAKQ